MPSMSGPLATAIPHEIAAGPFEKWSYRYSERMVGPKEITLQAIPLRTGTSAMLSVHQKTTGWLQFYLQGGAYNLPALERPSFRLATR